MKARVSLLLLAVVAVLGMAVSVAGEGDYPNCDVCKPLMESPDLMKHVRWDSQKIATGMISVTTVDPDYAKAFDQAHDKMMQAVERLEKGEKLELCPMCTRMGALAQAGATIENVKVGDTRVTAVTAKEPKVIDEIHAHMTWVQQEFGKHDHEHGG